MTIESAIGSQEFLGRLLREIRTKEDAGFQKDVAVRMGYKNPNMVAQLEAGTTKPGVGKLKKILKAYKAPDVALPAFVLFDKDLWDLCFQVEMLMKKMAKQMGVDNFDSTNMVERTSLVINWLNNYSEEYKAWHGIINHEKEGDIINLIQYLDAVRKSEEAEGK